MSKGLGYVETGVHVPRVPFWARVFVGPERLSDVKKCLLEEGTASLGFGDRLEIHTASDGGRGPALVVTTYGCGAGAPKELDFGGRCLVAWNEFRGDIEISCNNEDTLASLHGMIVKALFDRDDARGNAVVIEGSGIDSIKLGDVTVYFEREGTKDEAEPDDDRAAEDDIDTETEDPVESSRRRLRRLQGQILLEKVHLQNLGLRSPVRS